jgi:hypothetical protein
MDESTRARIRSIFLAPGRSVARSRAAALLGMTAGELEREIASGVIVAGSARRSRIGREELMAAAMRLWEQAVIEEALGDDATAVLPAALRLADMPARVPWYLREMLRRIASQLGTSVDDALTRELEARASAASGELAASIPGFAAALAWPERPADATAAGPDVP